MLVTWKTKNNIYWHNLKQNIINTINEYLEGNGGTTNPLDQPTPPEPETPTIGDITDKIQETNSTGIGCKTKFLLLSLKLEFKFSLHNIEKLVFIYWNLHKKMI